MMETASGTKAHLHYPPLPSKPVGDIAVNGYDTPHARQATSNTANSVSQGQTAKQRVWGELAESADYLRRQSGQIQ
jgi:hypothetical protein